MHAEGVDPRRRDPDRLMRLEIEESSSKRLMEASRAQVAGASGVGAPGGSARGRSEGSFGPPPTIASFCKPLPTSTE